MSTSTTRQAPPSPDSDGVQGTAEGLVGRGVALPVILALVLAVAGIGWWGLSGRDAARVVAIGETIDIPGGQMMVEELRPEVMVHQMASGMTMPDEIPQGYRRFSVDLVYRGGSGGAEVDPQDVFVAGDGLASIGPHRVTASSTVLPEGSTLAMSLLFQAPADVDTMWLGHRGSDDTVALEGDLGEGHDHGSHDHGDEGAVDGQDDHDHDHGDEAAGEDDHDHSTHDHGDEAAPAAVIDIDESRYGEPIVAVQLGDTVAWQNIDDGVPHTVTFSEDGPDSGVMQRGETFSVTLDAAGTYSYFCEIHPSMRGRITVEG